MVRPPYRQDPKGPAGRAPARISGISAARISGSHIDQQTWPDTTAQLLRVAQLPPTSTIVRGAGMYRYRKPPANAPTDMVVMWSDRPHDGVAVGEPWGGEGETAKQAIPPIAYVLTAALEVQSLSPEDWTKRKPTDESRPVSTETEPKP